MCEYINVEPIMVLDITSTEACKFDEHTQLLATLQATQAYKSVINESCLKCHLHKGTLPENSREEAAEKQAPSVIFWKISRAKLSLADDPSLE
jgi:hypothetical protein